MTINVGNTVQNIVIYGSLPVSQDNEYKIKFNSRYSNQEDILPNAVVAATSNGYYTTFTVSFDDAYYVDRDVDGYYELEFQFKTPSDAFSTYKAVLAKVTNSRDDDEVPTRYQSDNETNEQIIYYENE